MRAGDVVSCTRCTTAVRGDGPRSWASLLFMRSPLLAIFLVVLVDVLAFTLIVPLLPFYAERFGATPSEVGHLVSVFAVCQLLAGPMLGRLSDRVGRRPVLALSQLGTFAGFLVLAGAKSLPMVFLSRIIDGVTAGNLTVAQAAIVDVTKPEERGRGFALIGVSFGVGFLIGPALSAWLATIDLHAPVYLAAGLSLLSVILTLVLLPKRAPEPAPQQGSLRGEVPPAPPPERRLGVLDWGAYGQYLRRPALAARLAQYFLFSLSFVTFTAGFALYAERRFVRADGHPWGVREVGFTLAYSGVLGVILQGRFVGLAIARFGEATMVRFGFAFQALGFALLAFTGSTPALLAASTVASLGSSPLRPALTSLITKSAGPREQGTVLGLSQSLNAVAQIVAPLIAGTLIEHQALGAWAFAAGGASLLALAVPIPPPEAETGA